MQERESAIVQQSVTLNLFSPPVVLPRLTSQRHFHHSLFLLGLVLMQPHAETVQGFDSWLHQETHYF